MYAHNLFMLLRVFEGVLREKLELTEQEWQIASKRYGPLRPATFGGAEDDDADMESTVNKSKLGRQTIAMFDVSSKSEQEAAVPVRKQHQRAKSACQPQDRGSTSKQTKQSSPRLLAQRSSSFSLP